MSQSLKILLVTNRAPFPLKDGGALAMQAMINGYIQADCKVGLLTMNTSRHLIDTEKLTEQYPDLNFCKAVYVENEINLKRITRNFIFSKEPEHATRFYNVEFENELNAALSTFRPDVVQFESIFLSSYLPALEKHPQIIRVLRLHNIEHQIWDRLSAETKNPLKKAYLKNLAHRIHRYEKENFARFNLLMPITAADTETLKTISPNSPVHTAPFGISHFPAIIEEAKWVGYHIGAMDWLPNQEAMRWFIKEVWPTLRVEVPEFQFYYAGRNMTDEFYNYATLGVHCEGEVEDATSFIKDKKILIVPLKSGSGVRIKTMEAMAAGKLVISTKVGIQGIDLEAGKHYLQADTTEEFIQQIKWVFSNKAAALKISEEAKSAVTQSNDLSRISKDILTVLQKSIQAGL